MAKQLVATFIIPPQGSMSAEVIKQGEPGTSFFVIAQGELEVFIKDAAGEEKRVAQLSSDHANAPRC